ncbi:MAG: RIP metalloprotease RseP, partial [Myxococcota bacterium]
QAVIGREAREQILDRTGVLPAVIVACVGGGSNAMGIFQAFREEEEVELIGVEAAGEGLDSGKHSATLAAGRPGVLHGAMSYLLQDGDGQVAPAHSISAGLDYPGVGPEHSYLKDIGRAQYVSVSDEEALEAFHQLSDLEGIIPALESAHAIAHVLKIAPEYRDRGPLLVCLSGRGIRADVLIAEVTDDSPAAEVGLRTGDLIQGVDGVPTRSFESFADLVRTSGGRSLALSVLRDGETLDVSVTPALVQTDLTGFGIEVPRYRIGIVGNNFLAVPGSIGFEQVVNPLVAVPRAVAMTVEITQLFIRGLGKLITGDVPRNQLAGPIGIAEIAGKALERGWMDYLHTLILISINLGILNLLPIPLLDGGQAVVFLVEGVRNERLSLRTRECIQQIGFTMLVVIMGFAFWNDISRNWSRVVDWLTGGL